MTRALLLLFALPACTDSPLWSAPHRGEPLEPTAGPVAVRWTLTEEPGGLRVDYEIENRDRAPVIALDRLIDRDTGRPVDRLTVSASGDPSTVRLIAGSDHPSLCAKCVVAIEGVPESERRPIAPGASISGTTHLPLPLVAWHPDFAHDELLRDAIEPLDLQARWIVLEVEWQPENGLPRLARGPRLAIPR